VRAQIKARLSKFAHSALDLVSGLPYGLGIVCRARDKVGKLRPT
jgi:hypothetical protein